MRKLPLIVGGVFLLVLWLPAFQMHFGVYKEFDDTENRELATVPNWSTSLFSPLMEQIDAYVADHFGFRPDLIRWNSILRVYLLGSSPIKSVILGKDSWLFYCSEALADGNSMNDYMGMVPLPETELEKMRVRLEENRTRFSRHGIPYIVAIAPNKNTMYGEYLPERIECCKSDTTRLNQFIEYMSRNSDLRILDLREPLFEAKARQIPVYWETDSHWNTYGAYVGYREIMGEVSRTYPSAGPLEISGGIKVERTSRGGDLAQMLFLTDLLAEGNHTRFSLASNASENRLRKLVFRHDSFGDNLYPFLRKHFDKIVNVAPFAPFRFEEIFSDPPEVVLHVFTERYLTQAIHDDFFYQEEGG